MALLENHGNEQWIIGKYRKSVRASQFDCWIIIRKIESLWLNYVRVLDKLSVWNQRPTVGFIVVDFIIYMCDPTAELSGDRHY